MNIYQNRDMEGMRAVFVSFICMNSRAAVVCHPVVRSFSLLKEKVSSFLELRSSALIELIVSWPQQHQSVLLLAHQSAVGALKRDGPVKCHQGLASIEILHPKRAEHLERLQVRAKEPKPRVTSCLCSRRKNSRPKSHARGLPKN
jgi:hypothetical protein